MKKKNLIPKVQSLNELYRLAHSDPRYNKLAMVSASNLGGDIRVFGDAVMWLNCNAAESPLGERGVVDEVNFCRDLV